MLVEPPFFRLHQKDYSLELYPLALGYLAESVLQRTTWKVQAFNADFSPFPRVISTSHLAGEGYREYRKNLLDTTGPVWQQVRAAIADFRPSALGISAKTQNFASARIVARIAKQIDPQITVIVGGPHPTMAPEATLACPDIDIAVRGEGERTIVELLEHLEGKRPNLGEIAGIVYRDRGLPKETARRPLIEDLDELPFPCDHAEEVLRDYDAYSKLAFGRVFAIRGCPFQCFFCGSRNIWSRRVRFRSPENVVEEIRRLRNRGVSEINFIDDTFGVKRDYIARLCEAFARELPGLTWFCEMHVKLIDDATLAAMKAAGCSTIAVGVESGNNEILRLMRKNYTIEEALAACRKVLRHGIALSTFFMVGFPQETEASIADTLRAMKQLSKASIAYSIFQPYPGTEAFEFCQAHGLIPADYDVSLYNHQSPENCFCLYLSRDKFRRMVSKIERWVDRRNYVRRVRSYASMRYFRRFRQMGVSRGLRIAVSRLMGR